MKIAVLSDIHGNHFALEKCIEEIKNRQIDKLIFLGDYLGELAYPQKTMNIINTLRQCYECYFVRGNKEDYWIEYELLRHGEISHGEVLARAMRLLYNDTGKWSWPDIPEKYWERAIEELSKTGGMRQ